jgi:DNA-binding transcriptional LysR family regulator
VVLPLAGWPISKWQLSGAMAAGAEQSSTLSHEKRLSGGSGDKAWQGRVKASPLSPSTATYVTPDLLQPIQALDLLELGGTTTAAAEALCLSQPTVSRRVRRLVLDLGLDARHRNHHQGLRYGESACLHLLRRACQAHRLEAGAWRVGSCPWHQGVLQPLQLWVSVPGRFRHPSAWRTLVCAHAIDAAVVSGLDLQLALPALQNASSEVVDWEDCVLIPISRSPLGLLAPPDTRDSPERWSQVAVPAQQFAPGLASVVRQQQWQCLHAAKTCHDPPAWGLWLREHNRPALATPAWIKRLKPHIPAWGWHPWPHALSEQHWLLALRSVWNEQPALQVLLTQLRSAMACSHAEAE